MRVNIINVGIGNVNSLYGWVSQCYEDVCLLTDPDMYDGGAIIIPGACASNQLMRRLENMGHDILIKELTKTNTTIMGICAGFQVMSQSTTENEQLQCLGLIEGHTIPLKQAKSTTLWKHSEITIPKKSKLHQIFPRNKYIRGKYYFNHCFGVLRGDVILDYEIKKNVVGIQFHPEKSGVYGNPFLKMLVG